jgi:hypothetical protein
MAPEPLARQRCRMGAAIAPLAALTARRQTPSCRLGSLVAEARSLQAAQLSELRLLLAASLGAAGDAAPFGDAVGHGQPPAAEQRHVEWVLPVPSSAREQQAASGWTSASSRESGAGDAPGPAAGPSRASEAAAGAWMEESYRDWLTERDFQGLQQPDGSLSGSRPVAEAQEEEEYGAQRTGGAGSSAGAPPWGSGGTAEAGVPAVAASSAPPSAQRDGLGPVLAVDPPAEQVAAFVGLIPGLRVPDDAGASSADSPGSSTSGNLSCRHSEGGEALPLMPSDSVITEMLKRWAGWARALVAAAESTGAVRTEAANAYAATPAAADRAALPTNAQDRHPRGSCRRCRAGAACCTSCRHWGGCSARSRPRCSRGRHEEGLHPGECSQGRQGGRRHADSSCMCAALRGLACPLGGTPPRSGEAASPRSLV